MIEIIPAIDLLGGKCVRLEQGDYRLRKVYEKDPLDAARRFEDGGLRRLHLVDLDGAREKHVVNWKALERIAGRTSLVIDFGGGIKQEEDLRIVFASGAAMAVVGTMAAADFNLFRSWLKVFGSDRLILAADVKEGKIAVNGWTQTTGLDLVDFLAGCIGEGVSQVMCTDISRDGMLGGPAVNLYVSLLHHFPNLRLIASGGVSSVEDIERLQESGIPAVVIGKALYENKIKISELKRFM